MIYTTAEYIGMALLLVAFLGAGVALSRLDGMLTREPEGEGGSGAQAGADEVAATGNEAEIATIAERAASSGSGTASQGAPRRASGTRRERRKHGR